MKRTSLTLAGGLATALILVSSPGAHAAVTAKDAPSQADIVKAFPEMADATFTTEKTKQISVPGKECGVPSTGKAKSGIATTGASAAGFPVVVAGATEVKNDAAAKSYMKSFKAYVKKCGSFTEPTTGATITASLGSSLKLGDESLTVVQETTFSGITSYSSSVLIRDGKRIATVAAIDDAAVSTSALKKLAKVAAKKLK